MEESSEKRRERLRALREEAALAPNDDERGGSCVATPPDPPCLPLPGDLCQPAPSSPSPHFEFYTDPLAAFSGSRKKKSKNSLGSPFGGSPAPPPCKSPTSPFWQPDFSNLNPNLRPPGNLNSPGLPNLYPNLPPPGGFSTPVPPQPIANPHHFSTGTFYPGSFNTPTSNPNQNSNSSPHHSSVPGKPTLNSTPPGSFNTPGSADFNANMSPQGCYSNPGPSAYEQRSGFGSPQPLSAPQIRNTGGSRTPAPYQYNRERGGFSTGLSPQHRPGGTNEGRNNGWSQSGMSSGRSQGSNRSRGSFMQSPGSTGRDNRTPGRSGGRGFQRNNDVSASTNPELFAKRSMLLDPWKDLVPVLFESVAFRLNACSVTGSRDWLPKSVNSKGMASPSTKGVSVSASGPSLAESLAASFNEAVSGEDGA